MPPLIFFSPKDKERAAYENAILMFSETLSYSFRSLSINVIKYVEDEVNRWKTLWQTRPYCSFFCENKLLFSNPIPVRLQNLSCFQGSVTFSQTSLHWLGRFISLFPHIRLLWWGCRGFWSWGGGAEWEMGIWSIKCLLYSLSLLGTVWTVSLHVVFPNQDAGPVDSSLSSI